MRFLIAFILSAALSCTVIAAEQPQPATAAHAVTQPVPQKEPTAEQLKQFVTVIRQQRDFASQQAQDIDAQLRLVLAELEATKKELAVAQEKLAAATAPKKDAAKPSEQ